MGVCLVTTCYKRTEIAERYLDSIEKYVPYVKQAVILNMPNPNYTPKKRDWDVRWVESKQLPLGPARNAAMTEAIKLFDPEILWISDDDIICTENTHIDRCLPIVRLRGAGVVGFLRQMNPRVVAGDAYWKQPLIYISGGFLIRSAVLKKVPVWFTLDILDEKEFCLNMYLKGYTNYCTNRAYAIHEQGRAGEGGIRQAYKDMKVDKTIIPSADTKYGEDNLLISGQRGLYRCGDGIMHCGKNAKLTEFARSIHKQKAQFVI